MKSSVLNDILGKLLSIVGNILPTSNIIYFNSFPDYSDNPYAFCKYLIIKGIDDSFKLVWSYDVYEERDKTLAAIHKDGLKAKVVYRYSFWGVYYYLRARYVIMSHGGFDAIKLHQHHDKVIELWHGMPLKKIGMSTGQGIACSSNFDYVISTSTFYRKIISEAFDCTEDRVLVTGQPRCDLLFEQTNWFIEHNIDTTRYQKIGMWMPTFRKSIIGDIRIDGEYNSKGVAFLDEGALHSLDDFLSKNKILVLVKIHPMDALQNESFDDFKNIVFIKPKDFDSQLYPLLGSTDFLLTDYSSVYIDYQILRKPMGFVMNDIDSYKKSRGFYFDDLESALPGPVLSSYDLLCDFIQNPYLKDCDVNYNDFYDNHSSERLAKFLKLI